MGFHIQNHILIKYTEEAGITEVHVPDGVTEIGYAAFANCMFLEKINFPSTLKIIRAAAFEGCTSLTQITLPDGLEQIEGSAFFDTNLKEVAIPESINFIGSCAFGAPNSNFGWITFIFNKNQKKTRIMMEVLWLGYTPELRILEFFDHPCYENFSLLESNYKIQIAVSYYDTDEAMKNYLKRTIKKAVTLAIDRNDANLLTDLLHTGFITKKNIDFMIQYAIEHTQKNGNPELQVMLTDYKHQHFLSDTNQIAKKLKL